jgi:hypothetical protein
MRVGERLRTLSQFDVVVTFAAHKRLCPAFLRRVKSHKCRARSRVCANGLRLQASRVDRNSLRAPGLWRFDLSDRLLPSADFTVQPSRGSPDHRLVRSRPPLIFFSNSIESMASFAQSLYTSVARPRTRHR